MQRLTVCNFFNEDPGHRRPACACVSTLMASGTLSNPESHSHLSLADVITVTFDMAVMVKIVVLTACHVERTVNRARKAALDAIEGEVPTITAVVTPSNPEVTSKVNMEGSVWNVLIPWQQTGLQISPISKARCIRQLRPQYERQTKLSWPVEMTQELSFFAANQNIANAKVALLPSNIYLANSWFRLTKNSIFC